MEPKRPNREHPEPEEDLPVARLVALTLIGGGALFVVYHFVNDAIAARSPIGETIAGAACIAILLGAIAGLARLLSP